MDRVEKKMGRKEKVRSQIERKKIEKENMRWEEE
jgi:hypothetical protein